MLYSIIKQHSFYYITRFMYPLKHYTSEQLYLTYDNKSELYI